MMYTAPLADYLLDAREELLKRKINIDKLPIAKVKVKR
jgi:hypothetical protein